MSMEEIKYLKVNFHYRMPYFSKCLLLFYGDLLHQRANCFSENQALTRLRASLVSRRLLFVREVVLRGNDIRSLFFTAL